MFGDHRDLPVLTPSFPTRRSSDLVLLLNHEGKNFSIRGPLNSARPPQGQPIVVVAGASDSAMELAARTADVIFTVTETKEAAQKFYADVKGRLAKYGRKPDDLKVFTGTAIFVGQTAEIGRASCRERVCQSEAIWAVAGTSTKKIDPPMTPSTTTL